MDTKCAVCNQGTGHVRCDECGQTVCFSCFRFLNSRRLCSSCVSEWEKKRRWQEYAEQYARMNSEERAWLWARLSADERSLLEAQLASSSVKTTSPRGTIRKYGWLALPALAVLGTVLLIGSTHVRDRASTAGKKLGSVVGNLAGSVKRKFVGVEAIGDSGPAEGLTQAPGPLELVGQHLRKNGLPATAGNLRVKNNPAGEGIIVYSPNYFHPGRRLAWIVIGGQAYALSQAAQEVTPALQNSRTVPPELWKKTGLSRDNALRQLQNALWE